jgi:hypothetical protein
MTLGISPAVNSCTDPFTTAIFWFLALSSRRKTPAHRMSSSFIIIVIVCLCRASAATSLQDYFCRTPAAPVQPVFKILNFDNMRNVGMPDLHGNGGQSFPDLADPFVTAQRSESVGDSFVQGLGRHVDRVRDLVDVLDNNGAGFKGHDGNLSYSLFVRLLRSREDTRGRRGRHLRGVRGCTSDRAGAGDGLRSGEMSGRVLSDGILSIERAPRVRSVPTGEVRKLGAGNETFGSNRWCVCPCLFGSSVVVLGTGGVGLSVIQGAVHACARMIIVVDGCGYLRDISDPCDSFEYCPVFLRQ